MEVCDWHAFLKGNWGKWLSNSTSSPCQGFDRHFLNENYGSNAEYIHHFEPDPNEKSWKDSHCMTYVVPRA